jgi:hypothetical protein
MTDDAADRAWAIISTSPNTTDDPKAKAETAFADIAMSASSTVGMVVMLDCIGRAYNVPDLARHFANVIEGRHTGGRPLIDDSALVAQVMALIARGWKRSAALWKVARQAALTSGGVPSSVYRRLDKRLHAIGR